MKKIIYIFMCVITLSVLSGCTPSEETLEKHISELQSEIALLEQEKEILENEVVDLKVEKGTAVYVVSLSIKQKHINLKFSDHLKDELNELCLTIPVSEEYYNSVEVGDTLSEEFRVGSFVLDGSYGSWKIKVKEKQIL